MREIPLSKGKVALVSDEDYESLSQHSWYASLESRGTKWYAVRWLSKGEPGFREGKRTKVRMHRAVLNRPPLKDPDGLVVDHINHDSLDNRRENLELITQAENMRRSKGWKKKGMKVTN